MRGCAAQARAASGALKTFYVHRPLVNAAELVDWARSQGFATMLPADDMHTTVAFSRAPLDWTRTPPVADPVSVTGGVRSVEQLGDEGAVVLRFESAALHDRWQQFCDAGASWDYPSFQPHVTITYEGGDVDLGMVVPFAGELVLGPEVFAEVDDDTKESVAKAAEDQPRDDHGRFASTGGGQMSAREGENIGGHLESSGVTDEDKFSVSEHHEALGDAISQFNDQREGTEVAERDATEAEQSEGGADPELEANAVLQQQNLAERAADVHQKMTAMRDHLQSLADAAGETLRQYEEHLLAAGIGSRTR